MSKILFLNPSPLIKFGLSQGFVDNGWDVEIMLYETAFLDEYKKFQAIKSNINSTKPDLVFCEFGAGMPFQKTYDLCQRKGIPFYIWAIEDTPSVTCWADQIVTYCDGVFTTTVELISHYKELGKNAHLLMFGCNPKFHRPLLKDTKAYPYDLILIGQNYDSRYDKMKWFLKPIIDANYNLGVYGLDWWTDKKREFNIPSNFYKGGLGYEEIPTAYSTVPIGLGINCNDESETQMSMRPFEFLGSSNGLMVSFYTKAQENIFGDRLYLPKNSQETLNMVDEILSMTPEQRKEKADENREWVYANHNYEDRANIVIDVFNGRV